MVPSADRSRSSPSAAWPLFAAALGANLAVFIGGAFWPGSGILGRVVAGGLVGLGVFVVVRLMLRRA
jgi:hypothetical protein